MDSSQAKLLQLDFPPDNARADVGLEKKLPPIGFHDLDFLQSPKNDEGKEDTTKSEGIDTKDVLSDNETHPGYLDEVIQNDSSPDYLDKPEETMPLDYKDQKLNHEDQKLNHEDQKLNHEDQKLNHEDQKLNHEDQKLNHEDLKINYEDQKLKQEDLKLNREDQKLNREDQNLKYFDQTSQKSPQQIHRHRVLSCPCKECVENLQNRCEEEQKTTICDDQKNDEFLSCEDSVSINSRSGSEKSNRSRSGSKNSSRSRSGSERSNRSRSGSERSNRSRSGSEKSRRTNSSEEEHTANKFRDAQVTLPYPDSSRPPECISRLSNAGLYEPNEDLPVKANKDEDQVSQVVNAAFFVQHPDEKPSQQKKVQLELLEKVDVEKGEAEREPLIRTLRRAASEEPPDPRICQCNRGCLKIVGSFVTSMIVFPAFLYAAYAWLPFDAPLMPDIPTRLVYTLRCASFASLPIVLGVIIHGISRLCAASYDPFKPREREVTIHRRFVKQGTFLFVLYFFNLSVLATYLSQDHLKVIPLLTCLFTLAQLIYWLSFAVSRSFRGFGYGLTFLPLVSMMISNFYFMFLVEPEKMIFLGSRNAPQN